MLPLLRPEGYRPLLDELTTEKAIRKIKDEFQNNLAFELKLQRVTAPLFVLGGRGINDDLNGVERPVAFPIKDMHDERAEIVHSLAKWKRMKLAKLGCAPDTGIYTDMNAIRADEELDNLHSLYVDQWDWEKTITAEMRTLVYLKATVRKIYYAMRRTEAAICSDYPQLKPFLPEDIVFIHTEDLEAEYPSLTPVERETEVTKKYGAVFLIGIGGDLPLSGQKHDGRAPDYDDWSLNGDIMVYNELLDCAFELSSMGIRVDPAAMDRQLRLANCDDRRALPYHKALLNGELPLTIGGGIGQSRLSMLLLGKAHIGEVQASIWDDETMVACAKAGVVLL